MAKRVGRNFPLGKIRNAGYILYPAYILIWVAPFILLFSDFFSPPEFFKTIGSSRILSLTGFTLLQAVLSCLLSFSIALIPAYYAGKKKNVLSSLLDSAVFIPFFFPPVSAVIAFSLLYSSQGIFAKAGFDPGIMYTLKGVLIAHAFFNSPIFVRYISSALKKIPRDIIEEARMCGAGDIRIFLHIELPIIASAAARAGLMVFVYCFMSFAVVLSIGGFEFYTIEAEISSVIRSTMDFPYALSLAVIQLIVISAAGYLSVLPGDYETSGELRFEKKKMILPACASAVYCMFEYSIIIVALSACFYNFYDSAFDFSGLLNIFSAAFNEKFPVLISFRNSLLLSAGGSFLALSIAWALVRHEIGKSRIFIVSTMGVSSAFLSIGLLYTQIQTGIWPVLLFSSGCIINAVPIAFSFLHPHAASFNKNYIEEAKMCGAGIFRIFIDIEFPILKPAFIAAFLQTAMILFGEFTIAYTMQVQEYFPLVSTTSFAIDSARMMRESAAMNGLVVLVIVGARGAMYIYENRIRR